MFVRWQSLEMAAEEERQLPGYRDPAVIRTFDAPEALDTRFYEVRARSVLNRVPERSRMPFRWTINAYRGCSHACTYCSWGETPILMADGRTKRLAALRLGDEIYGTVRDGNYRRYTATRVLAHWSTVKPAYRVVLEDGTELVASGDHRFLSDRGWKYVTGAEHGRFRRPHLTLNNKLMGSGKVASAPEETTDYMDGYLCGLIRGDGCVRSHPYTRPSGRRWVHHFFRLALTDFEALRRAQEYLTAADVHTEEFLFYAGTEAHRPLKAIRTQSRDKVSRIRDLVRWPRWPSTDWSKGFLAGIFDAEGSYSHGILRIANCDEEIIDRTAWCLRRLGFDAALDRTNNPNGLTQVRVRGGLREKLRFFHTVDPAITRKRTIEGTRIKSNARLGVVLIEPLGEELELFDITTGTGDFIANGVVSHNCFARPTHTYLDFNARRDFEREIVVKVNAPERARAELSRPSWKRELVALGTNTDPYQWVEGRYKLMPGIWEALRDSGTPCSVLTKSPLLLRDLPIMREMAADGLFTAALSVPTIDEKAWRETEPRTPSPYARLKAIEKLTAAGIPTSVLVAPLIPGVNDQPEQVEEIVQLADEAGAVGITGIALHLRGEVRDIWFDWLKLKRPDLIPLYERLYSRGAYAAPSERQRLSELVKSARRKANGSSLPTGRGQPARGHRHPQQVEEVEPAPPRPRTPARADQPTLF
jgi:DNA repair photolyase